jgi:hypothetical protein
VVAAVELTVVLQVLHEKVVQVVVRDLLQVVQEYVVLVHYNQPNQETLAHMDLVTLVDNQHSHQMLQFMLVVVVAEQVLQVVKVQIRQVLQVTVDQVVTEEHIQLQMVQHQFITLVEEVVVLTVTVLQTVLLQVVSVDKVEVVTEMQDLKIIQTPRSKQVNLDKQTKVAVVDQTLLMMSLQAQQVVKE